MRAVLRNITASVIIFLATTAQAEVDQGQALHLLNRITYGPTAASMADVKRMGLGAYIEQQLHPEQMATYPELEHAVSGFMITRGTLLDIANRYIPENNGQKLTPEQRKQVRRDSKIIVDQVIATKLLRAIYDPAQLRELMMDFWFNHFNVFDDKGEVRILISTYERDAIRPYAMGKFRNLLEATAKHPAMLFYLDNWMNTDPNSRFAKGKFNGLNENYAREIMELHTMGVDGGYTQTDVTTLARILTGWGFSIGQGKDKAEKISEFAFDPRRHDFHDKFFLGHEIRGMGADEVEQAIDILVKHPSTAHHISYEIAQYFVADEPPESLVNAMAATFSRTDGDIRAVLSTMLYSKEFWSPDNIQNKFKTPLRYTVSAVRFSGIALSDIDSMDHSIKDMGQPLYHFLTPDGYSVTNERWLNSDALLRRIDFSKQLASGRFSRRDNGMGKIDPERFTSSMESTFGNQLSAETREAIDKAMKPMKPVLLLSSPEFLYY